ncbi:MAG: MucB/RseB C-terminal domain-containing protein, partial [Pseudomonadota bacterium]
FARSFTPLFERLSDHYLVETFGHGRVADRVALRLAVAPKDTHRYGYRLWVDEETSLLLRSELVDHDGRRLEIFQFASLRIGPGVDAVSLEPGNVEESMVSHLQLAQQNKLIMPMPTDDMMRWEAHWVPAGFSMSGEATGQAKQAARPMNTLMYSDGLANFSIFIEPMPSEGAADMTSQNGATLALTHALAHGENRYLVTLVGEIPLATARKIVRSLQPRPA